MLISILLLLLVVYLIYKYSTWTFKRWSSTGVPYLKPVPFFGNLLPSVLGKQSHMAIVEEIYRSFDGHRYCGLYNMRMPTLILRDMDLIQIFFKSDFSKAHSRGMYVDEKRDPLSLNLFFMEGQLWKTSREKLRLGFKPSRLSSLIPSLEYTADTIVKKIYENQSIEIKDYTGLYSAAVIAGPVLGLDLQQVNLNEFVHHSKQIFSIKDGNLIPTFLRMFIPKLAVMLGIQSAPGPTVDFFRETVKKAMASKFGKSDLMENILELQKHFAKEGQSKEFLEAIVDGQFFIFALAGFETTSTTISFVIYFLAKYQDVLEKVREEINSVIEKHGGISIESLKKMTYLENVINETLRLYPPVAGMLRVLNTTYHIPGSDIVLVPGDTVVAPTYCLHRDPRFFYDPDEFKPERFEDGIPDAFIPFGIGPRICIGLHLAMLEMKIFLCHLLRKFDLELDTAKTIPKLDQKSLFVCFESGVWVKFKALNK